MSFENLTYIRARAAEERERAAVAPSAAIRAVHLEFATRYEQMAGQQRAAQELQSTRNTVHRSLELLRKTASLVVQR